MTDYDDANPTPTKPTIVRGNLHMQALSAIGTLGLSIGALAWVGGWFASQNAGAVSEAHLIWMTVGGQLFGLGVLYMLGMLIVGAIRHRD